MSIMSNSDHFSKEYFRTRHGNDLRRQLSFKQERDYLKRYLGERVFQEGFLLDVGCSTGEFIDAIGWNIRNAYGMEISSYARAIAEKKGIRFDMGIFDFNGYFDLIVFRGTIQYLPRPFDYIKAAFISLKRGGYVVFLATPNSNSPYYCLFRTLPFLEEQFNYLIPSDISLTMNLKNCGFQIIDVEFPYLRSPYSRFLLDHLKFLKKLVFRSNDTFAFWRSSMNILARKP